MLILNEVKLAKSYKIYRDQIFIDTTITSSYSDNMLPGEKYCYNVTCVDQYGIESEEAKKIVESKNISYIANKCIKQEYQRLFLKTNPVFPALKK